MTKNSNESRVRTAQKRQAAARRRVALRELRNLTKDA